MNFAPQAIIPSSQQSAVFSDSPAIILVLSTADPKTHCSGSLRTPPARSGPATQDVAVFPADSDPICCVPPLPRDRPLTTGKGLCGYSLTVVHFRKVVIRTKIGSAGNGHPVIYLCGCMPAYYHP
ncbi:TPA: hypothetical protein MI579_22305 [Klebsiella pneumoniae]|nr:hypothetical protein [Klebsiella pneumoniae]HBY7138202.1 hypothetical protein [Klebsiella pneumoniae]